LAEDGARFTATIKRTEDGPQACYRVVFDVGERSMEESDIRLFKTDTEAINWLARKLIDAASPGGNALRSEKEGCLWIVPVWGACLLSRS
jgi:hypothetical protein